MSHTAVTPYLSAKNAAEALAWYAKVFGAEETGPKFTAPDGSVVHSMMQIGDGFFMLSEENAEWGNLSPVSLKGTTVRLNLDVADADEVANRAQAAGAEIIIPVADQFYGQRSGRIRDPFGHEWILSQMLQELSPEEMQRRFDEMFGGTV